ncbi:phosphatidylserine/phosphatidylglycerophosphate/cardiolipin synthase family protein [Streptomyces sp. NPDC127106]|uniref:phospholipase D-like domain-containing protein n=1 Tax=Streptomyces sp. NPDC127106 TaxID=3345360 RepID=UPI0036363297
MTYFTKYLPVTTGNSTRLYTDGKDYCADLYADIRSAKRFVFLTGLHFMREFGLLRTGGPADASATLGQVLRETGERGVEVFLLVNQFWRDETEVFMGGRPVRSAIMKAGELHGYLPETLRLFNGLKGLATVHCRTDIHSNSDIFGTHHQKTVVIDDRVAFLGGIDLTFVDGDRWDTPAHRARHRHVDRTQRFWHDVHMKLQGPAVEFVRDNFVQRWSHGRLHTIREKRLTSYEEWLHRMAEHPRPDIVVEATPDRRPPALPRFVSKPAAKYTYPTGAEEATTPTVQIVRSMPRKDNWHREKPTWNSNQSADWERSCKDAYLIGIRASKKYIYLENQWIADEDIWAELAKAADRNKTNPDYRIILMVPYEGLFAAGMGSNQELFIDTEIERVIKASHSRATFGMYALHQDDRRANVSGQIYVHSKVLIVDDVWSLIGSANAGGISLEGVRSGRDEPDTELSAIVLDESFASAFRSKIWSEHLGTTVGPAYDVRDADRFRALAGKPGGRLRFFPGYDSIKRRTPALLPGLRESRDALPTDFTKQSRIIPSLGRDVLDYGLPPTLVRAAFTARVVPSAPPGWRCWYRWHCQLHYNPSDPSGRDPDVAPVYLKLRSLKNDKDEVWDYSDQDSVYIGKSSAERINAETRIAVSGIIRCRVKILPLDESPHGPGPQMLLGFECLFLNETFARNNHHLFVRGRSPR